MFYGYNLSGWYMAVLWIGVMVAFGVALHLAYKAVKIDLERNKELYIVVITSLVALTPAVGPYLAFVAATSLTNRFAQAGLGRAIGTMTLAWLFTFAILFLVGLFRALAVSGIL